MKNNLSLPTKLIHVSLNFGSQNIKVGRLLYENRRIFFEYDTSFLPTPFDLSPVHLAKRSGVMQFDPALFEGLPGVFSDSLPDGWGRLLLDRAMRSHGIPPEALTPLDRLAHVGHWGMGALVYEPDYSEFNHSCSNSSNTQIDLNRLALQAHKIMTGSAEIVFDELLSLNGSSAGARPKALIGVNSDKSTIIHGVHNLPDGFDHWLVKFPNSSEGKYSGAIEYIYSKMAKLAGVEMTDTYLFPAKQSLGFYATKRFDRIGLKRFHLHSACGLLHSNFRTPCLDYSDLIKFTILLTRNLHEAEKMYRLAVFNVLSHNQDDHAKNFSYLMDETGQWRMSPAYDITYSLGLGAEQSTMVLGVGKNISLEQLINLGEIAELHKSKSIDIIQQCQHALSQFKSLAREVGIDNKLISQIENDMLTF